MIHSSWRTIHLVLLSLWIYLLCCEAQFAAGRVLKLLHVRVEFSVDPLCLSVAPKSH